MGGIEVGCKGVPEGTKEGRLGGRVFSRNCRRTREENVVKSIWRLAKKIQAKRRYYTQNPKKELSICMLKNSYKNKRILKNGSSERSSDLGNVQIVWGIGLGADMKSFTPQGG